MIAVRVPATSANLGPGFDAFGVAIDLHLTARLVDREGEARVTTAGEGREELPGDDRNLVWRSFVTACERFDAGVPDAAIVVDNAIPLERGLGSSSAAIVAGVSLGRLVAGAPVSDHEAAALAAELEGHPDNVVPALLGGLTVSAHDDDGMLVIRRANPHPALHPVVFVPDQRQSTVAARGVLPDTLPTAAATDQAARAGHVLGALLGAWPAEPRLSGDRLHEPPRLRAMPASGALITELRDAGFHAWLSGAGPTVAAAVAGHDLERCDEIATTHGTAAHLRRWDLAGATPRG